MASLGHLVSNSLWFAFDALDHQKCGAVPKSQLKVLTQNVGVLLGVNRRVENCVNDYLSVPQLSYEQYLDFLYREVLSEVDDDKKNYEELRAHHDSLDWAFWVLGKPCLLTQENTVLTEPALYKIFRVFCVLADRVSHKGALTQVSLLRGEVEEVTRCLVTELGREFDGEDFSQIVFRMPSFTFPVFVTFLEGRYLQDSEMPAVDAAIDVLYQVFVLQILEKGKLYQRLPFAPVWVCRDLELTPWELRPCRIMSPLLQPIQAKFNPGPVIKLTKKTKVNKIGDVPGMRPCRFTISTNDENKVLHFAAPDHRTKARWLRALDEAVTNSEEPLPYQRILSGNRKEGRAIEEEKENQEKIRRASQADIIEQTQAELVVERIARAEAEETAREETAARQTETKRVEELTTLQKELEVLLEQETQAKRDEEIVRNLQARVLAEEWEKREELELLQREQNVLLEEEKKKREAFEILQNEKETQLNEAQSRLRKLEIERLKLDNELRSAREKIVMSERGKDVLEARMKVKERTPPVRTLSLRPVRREQRATPLRSSSFNTELKKPPIKTSPKVSRQETETVEYDLPPSRSSFGSLVDANIIEEDIDINSHKACENGLQKELNNETVDGTKTITFTVTLKEPTNGEESCEDESSNEVKNGS